MDAFTSKEIISNNPFLMAFVNSKNKPYSVEFLDVPDLKTFYYHQGKDVYFYGNPYGFNYYELDGVFRQFTQDSSAFDNFQIFQSAYNGSSKTEVNNTSFVEGFGSAYAWQFIKITFR